MRDKAVRAAEVRRAIEAQDAAYKMLRWMDGALNEGSIAFPGYLSDSYSLGFFLREHYKSRPEGLISDDPQRAEEFGNMLSSFLVTTHDLVENPKPRTRRLGGCSCPLCRQLVPAPWLRPKKLRSIHKQRAMELMRDYLRAEARDLGGELPDRVVEELLEDRPFLEQLALATYAEQAVERMRGRVEGPALLALWRKFAWEPSGQRRHWFELTADVALDAMSAVTEAVARELE